jgi:hypothetical protein
MNRSLVNATLLSLTIGMGTAFAQAPPGQAAKMSGPDKEAISKACSDQANAKGLHARLEKSSDPNATSRWQGHVTPCALALTVQDRRPWPGSRDKGQPPTLLVTADEVIE